MKMNGIWIKNFYHCMPAKTLNKNGERAIIRYYCFGPIEAFEYGITQNGDYYLKYTYAPLGEDEIECDYKIISAEKMLAVINQEILLCENNGGSHIAEALKTEKDLLLL